MPWFQYRGMDDQGNPAQGRVEGESAETVRRELEAKGFTGLEVSALARRSLTNKASARELAILAQQFAVIIRSDITLIEGVDTLIAQSENRHIKAALTAVRGEIEQGAPFAEAMGKHGDVFPAYYLSMIRIGEVSGSLDVVFERLATYYEKEHKLRRKTSTAVTYPIILSVLMLAVIALLVLRVLPMFSEILNSLGGQMPGLTAAMLGVSNFLAGNGWWVLLVIVALCFVPKLVGMTQQGSVWYDRHKLHRVLTGRVNRRLITARFCQSFALLLRSGVSVSVALSMVAELLDNRYITEQLEKCRAEVEQGVGIAEALEHTGLFPELMLRMANVGQKTGRLDDILMNAAVLFDEEVDSALDRMTSSIEPVLIILLSVVVGVILFAIMLPMINILSAI